jgi:uncharacterized delta-60 repeat protein
MGRLRHAILSLFPLLAVACIGAEPAIVDAGPTTSDGTTDSHKVDGPGADTGTGDARSADAKAGHDGGMDGKVSHDGGVDGSHLDAEHDTGVDAPHDTGVDAALVCAEILANHEAGPPGSLDLVSFADGPKDNTPPNPSPSGEVIDAMGRIYVIGTKSDCVSSTSGNDFAVMRFSPGGLLDTSYGTSGTACVDFGGNTDTARGAAFTPGGSLVVVGASDPSTDTTGIQTSLAIAQLTTAGALDPNFNSNGTLKTSAAAPFGTCNSSGGLCAPPEAQIGEAVAIAPKGVSYLMYVVGTTNDYPASMGTQYNGAFIASFNADGSINSNFNAGYVTDDSLMDLQDVAIGPSGTIVVVGSDLGTPVSGGYKNRRFVTRRYTSTGTLDMTFGAASMGDIHTALGTNDYGEAVKIDPATGDVLVAGQVSVGGALTYANGYNFGSVGIVRFTSSGEIVTTFGTGGTGIYVSSVLNGYPWYGEHFTWTKSATATSSSAASSAAQAARAPARCPASSASPQREHRTARSERATPGSGSSLSP